MLMRHETTWAIVELPDLPAWRALGWQPHDGPPPVEPDPTEEPGELPVPVEVVETPSEMAGSFVSQPDAPEE